MKKSIKLLLSVLAITSTMAFAEVPVEKQFSLDKFSYLGVGFKDSKADLVAKGFECVASECKRETKSDNIKVTFSGEKLQYVVAEVYYPKFIKCDVNQKRIRDFLTENYAFEYVNQDRNFLGMNVTSRSMGGNISTTEGLVFVNVSCSYNSETKKDYSLIEFNLVDIVYHDFKKDFKYQ